MKKINSLQNPEIKNIKRLQKKENYRKKQKLVLVEGKKEIEIANDNLELVNYYYSPELIKEEISEFKDINKSIEVSSQIFQSISYRGNPDGHLAIFKEKVYHLKDIVLSKEPLIIVLDGIEKPSNLGAISRTACAVKADLIILVDSKVDIYNSNAIRSSTGHIFKTKIISSDFDEASKWLKSKNLKTLTCSGNSKIKYTEAQLNTPLALVFGSEDKGLKNNWLSVADEKIKISMLSKMDSLNLSVSVAVIVFEALRQRKEF